MERVWPDEPAVAWFLSAMTKHPLGGKRVLDTLLAATFRSANIVSLLTLNPANFRGARLFSLAPLFFWYALEIRPPAGRKSHSGS